MGFVAWFSTPRNRRAFGAWCYKLFESLWILRFVSKTTGNVWDLELDDKQSKESLIIWCVVLYKRLKTQRIVNNLALGVAN